MTPMAATTNKSIRVAEFVRLVTANNGTLLFSTLPNSLTVAGVGTFTALGSLLSISSYQRDIKSTSNDVGIGLTGLDPTNLVIVLDAKVKGSAVTIWRGFLDTNGALLVQNTITQFFQRYSGIVTNISITEDWDQDERERTATASLSCSSIRQVLENRISGIKTNQISWQTRYPNDTSMSRVSAIENTYFSFGQPVQAGGLADDSNGAGDFGLTGRTNETDQSGSE